MIPISDSVAAHRFPLLNIGLIVANLFVFFLQLTAVNPENFISHYALIPAAIDFSRIETLFPFLTSMFLHGGFLHIISNMLFLWVFGDNVEAHFGWLFFLPVYFISGIAAGVMQYFVNPSSTIPMIGASGAVAGMLGAYFVLFPYSKVKTLIPIFGFFTITQVPAWFMLGYWFLLQLLSGAGTLGIQESGGVAFFAHIGGFVAGYVFAKLTHPTERKLQSSWAI